MTSFFRIPRKPFWLMAMIALAGLIDAIHGGANAVELRQSATVTTDVVRLSDLFVGANIREDAVVAVAPAPGMVDSLSVSKISQIARRNGIAWRNTAGMVRVQVQRMGIQIADADTSAAIADAIRQQNPAFGAETQFQVDLASGSPRVMVAEGEEQTMAIDRILFNPRTGEFQALVRAPSHDTTRPSRRINGRAYPVVDIPVLSKQIEPGDVIRNHNIEWLRMPADRVSQNIIRDATRLVGMSPRRGVRVGHPVRLSDVEPPVAIEKGSLVTVIYTTSGLSLTARGKALHSASVGDTIDVLNERSHRTVQGIVTGPGEVRIEATQPLKLAQGNPASATGSLSQ